MSYKIRKLIPGHKIDRELAGKDVACIPERKLLKTRQIEYGEKVMTVDPTAPVKVLEFEDKWGRNNKYKLCYFIWRPDMQEALF